MHNFLSNISLLKKFDLHEVVRNSVEYTQFIHDLWKVSDRLRSVDARNAQKMIGSDWRSHFDNI